MIHNASVRIILAVVAILILMTGCAQKNHAPARAYKKDLVFGVRIYTVKKGDTLYSIGKRSGKGYKRLAYWNNLKPPYKLIVGQKIKLYSPLAVNKNKKSLTYRKTIKKKRTWSQKKARIPKQSQKLLKLTWQWPLKGRIIKTFAQTGKKGIDIRGKMGQRVRAAGAGKVVYSGHGLSGYGNLLIIKHNATYLSAYANNRRLLVKEKQTVKKGQVIAEVGNGSGNKESLHFEIRKNGKPVNPILYLPR